MKKIIGCILFACSIFSVNLYGQEGRSSFESLTLPQSAHAAALGGNNISIIEEDVMMANQNPALLGQEMDKQIGLNYMLYVAGINMAGFTYSQAVRSHGAFAVGFQYLGYGRMTQTEPDGTIVGSFNPKDIVVNGMFSYDITDRLRGGVNGKLLYSAFEQYSSLALAVDLGLNYYNPDKLFSASILFKNLGGQLKRYNEIYEKVPWDIQIGLSKTLDHAPIRFSVMAQHLTRWKLPYPTIAGNQMESGDKFEIKDNFASNLFRHLIFGVDILPTENVYIGVGYNYKMRSDMKTESRNFLSGFTAGAGIRVKMFAVGVSLSQHHLGGTSFMFNLNMSLADLISR